MPKSAVPLTDSQVEEAVAADKPFKLFDGKGLFLLVAPKKSSGTSKCWRFKYHFQGREQLLALGTYPEVSLFEARVRCEHARQLLAKQLNPGEAYREAKAEERILATTVDPGPSVSLNMDGDVVIRKGRSTLHLTEEESQFVAELLNKLR